VFRAAPEQLLDPNVVASSLALADDFREPSGMDVTRGEALLSLRGRERDQFARAEHRLRQSIFKATDGRLGRFNRRLSLPFSVALIRWTRLSPHVMSVLVMALGLVAGWLFSRGSYVSSVLAATVSLAASVLDGCDGEHRAPAIQRIGIRLLARYARRLHLLPWRFSQG